MDTNLALFSVTCLFAGAVAFSTVAAVVVSAVRAAVATMPRWLPRVRALMAPGSANTVGTFA